jgi:hypothetical protein
LQEERGTELVIEPQYGVSWPDLTPGAGWVLDRDVVNVRHLLLGALDTLAFQPDVLQTIMGILGGQILPRIDQAQQQAAVRALAQTRLDGNQKQAFANAYTAQNYYLVQGPPGTHQAAPLTTDTKCSTIEASR